MRLTHTMDGAIHCHIDIYFPSACILLIQSATVLYPKYLIIIHMWVMNPNTTTPSKTKAYASKPCSTLPMKLYMPNILVLTAQYLRYNAPAVVGGPFLLAFHNSLCLPLHIDKLWTRDPDGEFDVFLDVPPRSSLQSLYLETDSLCRDQSNVLT